MDDDRMARDVEVLNQVMETHGLTVKQLANRSGLAAKSIYKYLSDVRTLPSDVLRAAFEISGDLRLLMLISGSVPIKIIIQAAAAEKSPASQPRTPVRIPPLQEVLPDLLTSIKQTSDCAQYVQRVMADGVVNQADRAAIAKFQEHIANARQLLAVCDSAVESARERITR